MVVWSNQSMSQAFYAERLLHRIASITAGTVLKKGMNLRYHAAPVRNIQKESCRNCTILCPIGAAVLQGLSCPQTRKSLKPCKNQTGAKIIWHYFSLGWIPYYPLLNLKMLVPT